MPTGGATFPSDRSTCTPSRSCEASGLLDREYVGASGALEGKGACASGWGGATALGDSITDIVDAVDGGRDGAGEAGGVRRP